MSALPLVRPLRLGRIVTLPSERTTLDRALLSCGKRRARSGVVRSGVLLPARWPFAQGRFLTLVVSLALVAASTPAPAQANLPLYTDHLVNGFQDWSWGTRNLANTSPVHSGSSSVSLSDTAWNVALTPLREQCADSRLRLLARGLCQPRCIRHRREIFWACSRTQAAAKCPRHR